MLLAGPTATQTTHDEGSSRRDPDRARIGGLEAQVHARRQRLEALEHTVTAMEKAPRDFYEPAPTDAD